MIRLTHATFTIFADIHHEDLVIQVLMLKECALHLTFLKLILINIWLTYPFIHIVFSQTKVHILSRFVKYLHVLLYLRMDLKWKVDDLLGLEFVEYSGINKVRIALVLHIWRREIQRLFGRLHTTYCSAIENLLCLELLFVVKQHPHAVLINIRQLIVINFSKYLNLILICLNEPDKVSRILSIKIWKSFDKPLQLLQGHRKKMPKQELHAHWDNHITSDECPQTHDEDVLNQLYFAVTCLIGLAHLHDVLL